MAPSWGHAQDESDTKSSAEKFEKLPEMPKVEGLERGIPKTVWHDDKLWVFAADGTSGAALDVEAGKWTKFPNEKLAPPSPEAVGDEPRLDVRAAFGEYDAEAVKPSVKITHGPGGVEIDPESYNPRPYFGLDKFAGAKLRVDGGEWIELPEKNAPSPRRKYTYAVVRMGQKVAVWGGETENGPTNAGALFDLDKKKWTKMSTQGAPSPRRHPRVVTWTGDTLIMWGGRTNEGDLHDGAMYDPAKDAWTKMATQDAPEELGQQYVAVWDGKHLVYFATANRQAKAKGGVYDPAKNAWQKLQAPHTLFPTYQVRAWRADKGRILFASEAGPWMGFLDPKKGSWTSLPWTATGLSPRQEPGVHWTGECLIVWGGVQRKMVHPGGGCDGPLPPDQGCDPMPSVYQTTVLHDGAIYCPR